MLLLTFRLCRKQPPGSSCPFCGKPNMYLDLVPRMDDNAFTIAKDDIYHSDWNEQFKFAHDIEFYFYNINHIYKRA